MDAKDLLFIRRKLKMSQREFSLAVGMSVRTLQGYEQGRRHMSKYAESYINERVRKYLEK